jgi:general secretion pathway protein H
MISPGKDPRQAGVCRAFTLIELLVVILIIGIIINLAVVSMRSESPSDLLRTEAKRLSSLIGLASEEALLRSELIGVLVEEDSYRFVRREADSWLPIEENLFRQRKLPEAISFRLLSENPVPKALKEEKQTPDIVLLSSGEMTPFELKISSQLTEDFFRLTGVETGELKLDHVEPF